MDNMIGKGDEAAEALMLEVEGMFDMTVSQRQRVKELISLATRTDIDVNCSYASFCNSLKEVGCKVSGQPFEAQDYTDGDGNPDGGFIEGCGLSIRWQRGALDKDETPPWNGAFAVTVLEAVLHRLEYYQSGKFRCQDNQEAIVAIEEAIDVLNRRQIERFCRGVQGEHKK